MRYYETIYIINPNLTDEEINEVITKFNSLIEKHNGVLIKADEWGKKTLAYRIKKFNKGYYVLLEYCGGSEITGEIKRELKLDDRILKYQTIKLGDNVDPEELKSKTDEGKMKSEEVAKATRQTAENGDDNGVQ